ncbi:hypothetical protein ACTPEM_23285, partial [Clostridioides difficile]
TAFYVQMIEESEIGGNRVTDIRSLTDYLDKTLRELEQGKKDEGKILDKCIRYNMRKPYGKML